MPTRLATLLTVVAAAIAGLGSHPPTSSSSPLATSPPLRNTGGLAPSLDRALRRAQRAAAAEGVELRVTSGRRTRAEQARLFADAVTRYGSEAEAARWVAPPDRSAHVTGRAIDVGPPAAAAWLTAHGAAFGLCRVYENEPWHFERRAGAAAHGCPARYADAADDPRLRP